MILSRPNIISIMKNGLTEKGREAVSITGADNPPPNQVPMKFKTAPGGRS